MTKITACNCVLERDQERELERMCLCVYSRVKALIYLVNDLSMQIFVIREIFNQNKFHFYNDISSLFWHVHQCEGRYNLSLTWVHSNSKPQQNQVPDYNF